MLSLILYIVSPFVTEHPQDQNVTISKDNITLNCTATGFPSPTITWFHNNTLEVNTFYISEAINAYTTRSTFTKSMAETDDSGAYFCRAVIDGYDDVNSDTVTVLVQGDLIYLLLLMLVTSLCINFSMLCCT